MRDPELFRNLQDLAAFAAVLAFIMTLCVVLL